MIIFRLNSIFSKILPSSKNINLNLFTATYSSEIPKNKLTGLISADQQRGNGAVYDKRPFKMALEAGKKYCWCLCGKSKSQPLCDGTHKRQQLKIAFRPIKFEVEESKEYWLCNCKHTNNRPFCDGTHKLPIVQEQTSISKN